MAAQSRLWVRVPRLPLADRAHGPTGRHQLRTLKIRVQFPVSPLTYSPVVQRQRLLAYIQDNDGSTPSGTTRCPGTPTGRAARLKPARLRVRLPPWALMQTWLGRQSADHLGLEPEMLWVRVPPELLKKHSSSWSSLECSPALSRRRSWVQIPSGTLETARYANWQSGEAQTFVICGFDSRLCYSIGSCSSWRPVKPLSQNKRGGRREVQFLHDPLSYGPFVYRFRTPASQAGKAGSIPARVTDRHGQVVELADTRRSERRALRGVGVRLSPWSLNGSRLSMTQVSQCSAEPHKLGPSGATPEPAT